jgi:aminomethyltransferase
MTARMLLHAEHVAAGARMGEESGWLVPLDFGAPAREYAALRQGAGLADLSSRGKLRVTGADRARFLHNLLSNDIVGLAPGRGCQAAKLNLQGKMEAGLTVLCLSDELRCDLEPGPAAPVFAALAKHLVRDKAVLEDVTSHWAMFAVQGPRASDVLQAAGVATSSLDAPLQHAAASVAGVAVLVVHADHCGAGGFGVWVPAEAAAVVWTALRTAGDVVPVGWQALEVRRIEAGMPRAGAEINGDTFPMEAGLDAGWISYTKGCYLGQETIARIHHLGHVNRHLCGLLVEGETLPVARAALFAGEKNVGWVTSAAWSPTLERAVALAYVHREHAAPGNSVVVEIPAGRTLAHVAALPLA